MGFDSFNRTPWQRSEREYYDGAREVEKRVEIGLEELVKPPEERNAFELLAKSTPPKRTEKWDSLFKQMGSYFYQSKRLIAPITPIDSLFRQMTVDLSVELRTLVGRYNEGGRGIDFVLSTELRTLVVQILQTLGETGSINDEIIDRVKWYVFFHEHMRGKVSFYVGLGQPILKMEDVKDLKHQYLLFHEHMRNDVAGKATIILEKTIEKVKTIREKSADLSCKSSSFEKSDSETIRTQAAKLRKKADELNKLGSNIMAIAQKIMEEEAKMEADELLQSADMELLGMDSAPAKRTPIPPEWKNSLYEQQKGLCFGCKRRFEVRNLSVDHIKPVQLGGETELGNLQLLCQSCNSTKGTGTQEELISKLTKGGIL